MSLRRRSLDPAQRRHRLRRLLSRREFGNEVVGGSGDAPNGAFERITRPLRWHDDSADLAHVLARGSFDLFGCGVGLEPAQRCDVSAHGSHATGDGAPRHRPPGAALCQHLRMTTEIQRWKVGNATITSVVEDETHHIPPEFFFPAATAAEVAEHPWLVPDFADEHGNIALRVQAFVVEIGLRRILVDPCVGNGKTRPIPFWNEMTWPFFERFTDCRIRRGRHRHRRAHASPCRSRRLGHAPGRRRLGTDVHQRPAPLHRA